MTDQPYPAGSDNIWITEQPPRPPSVATAMKLMYAGAALQFLSLIVSIARIGNLAHSLMARFGYPAGQAHNIVVRDAVLVVTGGPWMFFWCSGQKELAAPSSAC